MQHSPEAPKTERWISVGLWVLFFAAFIFNVWGVSVGWKSMNLPGCEFRQTQTAISALFIQRENNFSLAYPTPVLGKPWSIPFEFPLYQWSVAGLSNITGWSLTVSGRAVSVACFYLSLPAFLLLLGEMGWQRYRQLSLALILSCPLYIFYARAFLIETMALMFGAWFLVGYLRVLSGRWGFWMAIAATTGAACGLVKVTTFAFFLMPAFIATLWWLYRDWRTARGVWSPLFRRALGCLATVALPCLASLWWLRYADAVKMESPAGRLLVSKILDAYVFGSGAHFSGEIWRSQGRVLTEEITSWPALMICAGAVLFGARRIGWAVAGLLALFLAVQVIFPVLYAWHAYYYVANAFVLMIAFGLALGALLDSRAPRLLSWSLVLIVLGLQAHTYLAFFHPGQAIDNALENKLIAALRRVTSPNEVLVVAGDDWSSVIPYYSERRAFMIRRSQESDWDTILPSFYRLGDEDVTALVLCGAQAENRELIRRAAERFGLDPAPAFRWGQTTVHLHRAIRHRAFPELKSIPDLEVFPVGPEAAPGGVTMTEDALDRDKTLLPSFADPRTGTMVKPYKYQSTYGLASMEVEGRTVLSAHPTVRLWYKLGPGARRFTAEAMLLPAAYATTLAPDIRSDGVEIRLEVEDTSGNTSAVFSRVLNPRDQPDDAGLQLLAHTLDLQGEGVVVLSVNAGPHGNAACDWAVLGRVAFE